MLLLLDRDSVRSSLGGRAVMCSSYGVFDLFSGLTSLRHMILSDVGCLSVAVYDAGGAV